MRKKSHISLARYIVKSSSDEALKKHWLSFYVGSILPDCKPSFLYKKHEITGTFPEVKRSIDTLVYGKKNKPVKNKRKYYLDLGQVTHYIADYFTFPHNKLYSGGLKEHCAYEEELKHSLRSYLRSPIQIQKEEEFATPEALCDFIEEKHGDYLNRKKSIDEDIHHIVSVNHQIVEGISDLYKKVNCIF